MGKMNVTLCGIEMDNPIIPASGTFGYGYEFAELYDINCLGTFSFKGTTKDEIFYEKEFAELGASVTVTTADGSYGVKGFVTNAMEGLDYSYFYTCGPEPMLKAVYDKSTTGGQFSFEERMGCGFGACMGCTCKTKYGNKRICRDGPVLMKEEIIW